MSTEFDKLISLNKEELKEMFSKLSASEIEDLIIKIEGLKNND